MNSLAARALFESETTKLGDRLLTSRGWTLHTREFPHLELSFQAGGRGGLRLRLSFDDWNDSPPSVALLNPDGTPLATLPQQRGGTSIFNTGPHSSGRPGPFVCMAGIREYHQHNSHRSDAWDNYRAQDAYSLGGILTQLWRGWEKSWP